MILMNAAAPGITRRRCLMLHYETYEDYVIAREMHKILRRLLAQDLFFS